MLIAVGARDDQQEEDDQEHRKPLQHPVSEAIELRNERLVFCLLQNRIKYQHHRGQDRDACQHAEEHALRHDEAEVHAQCVAHKAQGDETGDGGDGAADDGGEGRLDSLRHSLIFFISVLQLLLIAVPQEDRVIQRDAQLQDRRQRLGHVRDGTEDIVCSEVVQDGDPDAEQEDERHREGIHREHQNNRREDHSQNDVNRCLAVGQLLCVDQNRRNAGDEAVLAAQRTDLPDRLGCLVRSGGVFINHEHHRGVAFVELVVQLLRNDFLRNREIQNRVIPEHILDMIDMLDL